MSEVLIIGSPNCGKSLLFNRLTGLSHKVANFPGVTVDVSAGKALANPNLKLRDFPGIYSLNPISEEERIAVNAFKGALAAQNLRYVLCMIDATRLERSLFFALQVIRAAQKEGKPVLVLANMMDTLKRHNIEMDTEGLSKALGATVLPLSAKTGEGLDALNTHLKGAHDAAAPTDRQHAEASDESLRATAHELAQKFAPKGDLLIKSQSRADAFFLHSALGGLVFAMIMYVVFQSIFTWAEPAMTAVEDAIAWMAGIVVPLMPNQGMADFVDQAIFGGFGSFLVFVPQIFVLTLIVGILEDSGYLARAAVICHRPLRFFGLTGKSFVPMLSGVACAIPGIYAARTIESKAKRWLTYMAVPLMPCAARLPVYALLIAAFIPSDTVMGGLFGWQGLAMFAIFGFGMLTGLLVTAFMSRAQNTQDIPFVLEMPPYRAPALRPLLRNSWNRTKDFVTKAGVIIFTVTVVVWFLGYFPNSGENLEASYLGQIGRWIEPIFAPLALDWKYGVAIITSFLAREVFVGTLGTLFGIEGADENVAALADQIQASGLTLASGMALVVFFAIALQCVSTLAVLRREAGSWKLPVQMFAAYSVLAYVAAWITYLAVGAFT